MSISNQGFTKSLYLEFHRALSDPEKKDKKIEELCLRPILERIHQSQTASIPLARLESSLETLKSKKIKDLTGEDQDNIRKLFASCISEESSMVDDSGIASQIDLQDIFTVYQQLSIGFREAPGCSEIDFNPTRLTETTWRFAPERPAIFFTDAFVPVPDQVRTFKQHESNGRTFTVPEIFYADNLMRGTRNQLEFANGSIVFSDLQEIDFSLFNDSLLSFVGLISPDQDEATHRALTCSIMVCLSQALTSPIGALLFSSMIMVRYGVGGNNEIDSFFTYKFEPRIVDGAVVPNCFRIVLNIKASMQYSGLSAGQIEELKKHGLFSPVEAEGRSEILVSLDENLNPVFEFASLSCDYTVHDSLEPATFGKEEFVKLQETEDSSAVYEGALRASGPLELVQADVGLVGRELKGAFRGLDKKKQKEDAARAFQAYNERAVDTSLYPVSQARVLLPVTFIRDHLDSKGMSECEFQIGLSRPFLVQKDVNAENLIANVMALVEEINPPERLKQMMFLAMLLACTQDFTNPLVGYIKTQMTMVLASLPIRLSYLFFPTDSKVTVEKAKNFLGILQKDAFVLKYQYNFELRPNLRTGASAYTPEEIKEAKTNLGIDYAIRLKCEGSLVVRIANPDQFKVENLTQKFDVA